MRIFALALAFLAAAAGLRAQTVPGPSPAPTPLWLGDPGVDVEQARARRLKQKADWLRWEEATTAGDYERVGRKDPRWDADVRTVFDELAHALAQVPDGAARVAAAKAPCRRALAAGCDDPLLAYDALRLGFVPAGASPLALARLYAGVEGGLEKSGYSPLRKLSASLRAAQQWVKAAGAKAPGGETNPPDPRTEADAALGRAQTHLVELLRDPAAQRDSVYVIAEDLFRYVQHDAEGQAQVFPVLELVFDSGLLKAAGETETARLIEGTFWIDYAWQGRTTRYANDLKDENWKLFRQRLPRAQAALEKAYALDPADPRVCSGMMTVELGQGQGRERLETWFRRALDADPDDYAACSSKLYYLDPEWYGDAQAMLAFGHECQATANWPARLPFILLRAHAKLAAHETTPLDYWKRPEVWADVQRLYQDALAADPDSVPNRSGYALYAYRAGQWKLAEGLFQALGDAPDLGAMECTSAQYQEMRRVAAAKAQEEPPAPAP